MFSRVAPKYDAINHAMCFGLDVLWRKALAKEALSEGAKKVLDIACGSGDVSLEIARVGGKNIEITALDFCVEMLDIARKKIGQKMPTAKINFVQADCENMPFENEIFDSSTISFGFRNFKDRPSCLREIARVLKKDGVLCVLEVARSPRLIAPAQNFFMEKIVPNIAALFGGKKEDYVYLAQTTRLYPAQDKIEEMMRNCGFKNVKTKRFGFGLIALTFAKKA